MAVHDFNKAALRAYRKRQGKGAVEVVDGTSALVTAAKADPDYTLVDVDWLIDTLEALPPDILHSVQQVGSLAAQVKFGSPTPSDVIGTVYSFLRHAEEVGMLARWRMKT